MGLWLRIRRLGNYMGLWAKDKKVRGLHVSMG